MKIVSYATIPTDKLKAAQDCTSEYKIIEEIKQDIKMTHCIPLSDIDSFGTYQKLSDEEYEIVHQEGFILNEMDEDGRCLYVREDVLI